MQLLSKSICANPMTEAKLKLYKLTAKAQEDLEQIWLYGAKTWSASQADQYIDDLVVVFEMLVAMPAMARERKEFTPPVRIHVHRKNLIIYTIVEDYILIIRILAGKQDWRTILDTLDI